MSPITRSVVRFTQRIKNSAVRNQTLALIEVASKQPDLAHFTIAECLLVLKPFSITLIVIQAVVTMLFDCSGLSRNPTHTSHNEPRPHATVLLATKEQADANRAQAIHIFHDETGNYSGHELFPIHKFQL
ncbi:uncharacterized protein K489DRAFT_403091 [Dissoconium aciculare CBS 342.82]|uniref:Uncharacterized protein n=1 Tax=Dissoconium aciculare CBS 342.82 TaxID=1314786 RepID=A0A6J3M080_9PEZI|nr:uncharacterized protein K489DRAFT_403091 [Dissoconium aciculare CBS 342.82]KAF1821333.1 hypothetical protein K489DRAFT_403091 [Dissoconium aciculare CBS 342.82]